ncbi:hypothetical protein Q3G72_018662 [Acer saccharum]|nr:hypothetical protein Q3G72_018662 [Acer saccharum]
MQKTVKFHVLVVVMVIQWMMMMMIRKLLRKMRQFGKLLDGTRFLIVPDDVNTSEVWETLLVPICSSSSQSGGRIIVTTRDSGIFPRQNTYSALHLGRLNEEESWRLFSNKVQITEDELNNSELITFKDQILNICGGLPPTIALLGANAGFFYQHFISSLQSSGLPKLAVWRLEAYLGIKHFPYSQLDILNLCSCTAFDTRIRGTPAREIGMLLNKIVTSKGFGLLTVLDLEGVYKPKLSDDVMSKMLLLSYLGLRSTFIDELPGAVTDLAYLETLDLKHTNIRTKYLTFKSERLRHVQSFTRLRKLKLIGWPTLASEEIAEWITKLTSLETLKLVSISDDSKLASSITLCTTLKVHHKLQELYLVGILPKSVFDVGFLPPNLTNFVSVTTMLRSDAAAPGGSSVAAPEDPWAFHLHRQTTSTNDLPV